MSVVDNKKASPLGFLLEFFSCVPMSLAWVVE